MPGIPDRRADFTSAVDLYSRLKIRQLPVSFGIQTAVGTIVELATVIASREADPVPSISHVARRKSLQ